MNKKYTRHTLEEMQQLAIDRNGECLSDKYINTNTKLRWKCNKDGHEWEATPSSIIYQKSWCPKCYGCIKLNIKHIKNFAKKKNYKCLSNKYIDSQKKLRWKCNKDGYEWEASYSSLQQNQGCPKCAGRPKYTIEDIHKIAKEKNGICISDTYINNHTKLKWKCNICGFIWAATPSKIKMGRWCPNCRTINYNESIFRNIIEFRTGLGWSKSYPEWMKIEKYGPQELDMYNKDLKIAIEYNDHKIKLNVQSEKSFEKQKKYDIMREQRCKDNNVKLIWVPLMKIEEMDKYIKKLCKDNNIDIVNNEKLDYKELSKHSRLLVGLKECRRIAKERDGELLSNYYLGANKKLRWKCNKDGYEWDTTPHVIINQKSWCPKCVRRAKYTIEDMKKIAKERDGKCLSKEYKGLKYKLLWKCNKDGCKWLAKGNSIVINKSWCPECWNKRRGKK